MLQFVEGGKFLLAPHALHEGQAHGQAVGVAVVVENVYLDAAVVAIVQRGTHADVQHPAAAPPPEVHLHGIDPVGGDKLVRVADLQVGGGKAQPVAYAAAAHHRAFQKVAVAQAIGRQRHVALLRQQLAHQRGADGTPVGQRRQTVGLGGQHLHAQFAAVAHVVAEALRTVVPEAVVVAYHQHADVVTPAQHLHELPRRKGGQMRREVGQETQVQPRLCQQGQLLLRGGEQPRAEVGLQHLARMYGEGDDRRRQPTSDSLAAHLAYQEAVPPVHAVKEADGRHARRIA